MQAASVQGRSAVSGGRRARRFQVAFWTARTPPRRDPTTSSPPPEPQRRAVGPVPCDSWTGLCPIRRTAGSNSAASPGRNGASGLFAALATQVGCPRYGAKGVGITYPSSAKLPVVAIDAGELSAGKRVVEIMVAAGFAKSNGAARRLIEQGGVKLDSDKVEDANAVLSQAGVVLRVGKKRAARVIVP
jgi:hypothetical protein